MDGEAGPSTGAKRKTRSTSISRSEEQHPSSARSSKKRGRKSHAGHHKSASPQHDLAEADAAIPPEGTDHLEIPLSPGTRKSRAKRSGGASAVPYEPPKFGSIVTVDLPLVTSPTSSRSHKGSRKSPGRSNGAPSNSAQLSSASAVRKPNNLAQELFEEEGNDQQDRNDEEECSDLLGSPARHMDGPSLSSAVNPPADQELQLRITKLEAELRQAKSQLATKDTLVNAQHTTMQELYGQCTCHICLELVWRPCVLAPCGHIFCIHCLRSWFTKPLESEAPIPTHWSSEETQRVSRSRTLKRKKICPSCRTELACPPVEIWLVRQMLEKVDEGLRIAPIDDSGLPSHNLSEVDLNKLKGEGLPAGPKLWEDIFDAAGPRRIIFDESDHIPRCGACASEVFDGMCSNPNCGISYSDSEYGFEYGADDFDLDDPHGFEEDDSDMDMMGGARRLRHRLARRIAAFQRAHGGSEDIQEGRVRMRRWHQHPDEMEESDDEPPFTDEEFDEEMRDFILPDGTEVRFDDDDLTDHETADEDGFLPGPRRRATVRSRRGNPEEAIEVSDDSDEDTRDEADDTATQEEGADDSVQITGSRSQGDRRRGRVTTSEDLAEEVFGTRRRRGRGPEEEDSEDEMSMQPRGARIHRRNETEDDSEEDSDSFIDDDVQVYGSDSSIGSEEMWSSRESRPSVRRIIPDEDDE